MKKKSFVAGALILTLASVIAKVIGAIFRIPLTHLLGTEGIGIYQLIFPIYALFLVISSSGIPVALSKIISKEYSKDNYKNIDIIFKCSLFLMFILGFAFTIIIIILSKTIASLQNNINIFICYIAIAPAILFATIISAYRGYFQGLEIMKFSAISQVIEQMFKLLFGLLFAYFLLRINLTMGVLGAVVGVSVSEILTTFYLLLCYKKKKIKSIQNSEEVITFKQAFKFIIKEATPITLNSIVSPIISVIDSLIIIKLLGKIGLSFNLSSSLYGLESGVVASLVGLPSIISVSLGVSLMPSLSSSFSLNKIDEVKFKSKLSIKLVWYFTLPCVLIFILMSKEICFFLYGNLQNNAINQLEIASELLKVSSLSIIYVALNQITTTIMQAINKSYLPLIVLTSCSVLKIILTIILVQNAKFNIYGLALADVICFGLACFVNLLLIKKYLPIKFKFHEIVLVPLVSLIGLVVVIEIFRYFFQAFLFNRLAIVLIILSAFVVYLLLVIFLKGFSNKEIDKTKILNFIKNKKY